MTLAKLKLGDRAVITHIDASDGSAAARLAARGIVPGTQIGVLRAGNPCLVGIENDRWALNGSDAERIHVDLLDQPRRGLRALFGR